MQQKLSAWYLLLDKKIVLDKNAFRLVTVGRNLGVTSHTPIQLCLCGTYLMKREVLVVTS